MKPPRSGSQRQNSADTLPDSFFTQGSSTPSLSSTNASASASGYTSSHKSAPTGCISSAARFIADALTSCFTPPEMVNSTSIVSNGSSESSRSNSNNRQGRSKPRSIYGGSNASTHSRDPGSNKYTMEEILKATKNFSPNLKIGQGGFGTVYKGRVEDGTHVAVKRAKKIVHDKHLGVEFQSEVKILSNVEHLNLVKFYGCLEYEDERILVVEYVPNGTLREHLDCMHGDILDFSSRLDIAIDVAHAITYLHMYTDHPIIHRDVKSSNILLTENLRAKVADFGFARLAADSDSGATHVSTQVKGTAGYLDPEYLKSYQLTEKSDVYSFGILLVEMITGRRPIEQRRDIKERITARWAIKLFTAGEASLTLDPRLTRSSAIDFATEKLYELALQCLANSRHNRPTMRTCSEILWTIRKDYKDLLASEVIA